LHSDGKITFCVLKKLYDEVLAGDLFADLEGAAPIILSGCGEKSLKLFFKESLVYEVSSTQ
jgi:hypothetical protein